MKLISKFNKGIRFLLCIIDIFTKYAWIVPLKDKNDANIINAFQKVLSKSDRSQTNMGRKRERIL